MIAYNITEPFSLMVVQTNYLLIKRDGAHASPIVVVLWSRIELLRSFRQLLEIVECGSLFDRIVL